MRRILLTALVLSAVACDDDTSATTDASVQVDAATDACEGIPCGEGGTCVLVEGLPACECDEGLEVQGLDCVDPQGPDGPPADFTCPAPGTVDTEAASRLTTDGWMYRGSDRSCTLSPSRDIYRFAANGVFTRHSQFGEGEGGNLVYGCWTLESETDGVLSIAWDHAEDNPWALNCGAAGGLEDPPCNGALKYDSDAAAFELQANLPTERHLLYRAPAACTWCNDAAECCAEASWVEADGEALCE